MPHSRDPRPLCVSLGFSLATAWFWTVLLADRAVPWQASRWWVLTLLSTFALSWAWSWRIWRRAGGTATAPNAWCRAALLGAGPIVVAETTIVALAYSTDAVNDSLRSPFWRMQVLAGAAALMVAADSLQVAAAAWLQDRSAGTFSAALRTLQCRSGPILLACLAAVGVLQATAYVTPFGDDIGHYSVVADALLRGQPYPNPAYDVSSGIVGVGASYPVLPTLPLLLMASFSLLGRNLVSMALPAVVASALFPLALYALLATTTKSRTTAYLGAAAVSLFPTYQIHVLGGPQPDTLFIDLLLLAAALAARADSRGDWASWVATGVVLGLASLTRHEGMAYAMVILGGLLVLHRGRWPSWLSLASYGGTLLPFVAVYHAVSGSYWPTTFGAGLLRWSNVEANLALLRSYSVPWYSQAIGIEPEMLNALMPVAALTVLAGAVVMARQHPALALIPLAGMGNFTAVFFMHPNLVYSAFPPDFLRHISYGIAFAAVGLIWAVHAGCRYLGRFLSRRRLGPLVGSVALLLAASLLLYYESERLARPEWWFGGRSSLLWTSSGYLLVDLVQNPVSLPSVGDPRTGEQLRIDLARSLQSVNLYQSNKSEPYHWTSLVVVLLGAAYSLAEVTLSTLKSRAPARCPRISKHNRSRPSAMLSHS